jgi:integrase
MDKTKTARRQRIVLPPEIVALLEAHIASMNEAERESELLFPAITGGLRARSCLDKPFRVVAKEIKLKKTITPRAMRRSFNDLARAAEVKDVVTRAISGHVTDSMQQHYSTVSGLEVCDGIAKVVSLARFKEVLGGKRGGKHPEKKKAG